MSDADAIRAMLRQVTLASIDDSGAYQRGAVKGYAGESIPDAVRLQNFGFHSVPPAGAKGVLASLGGRAERPYILGVEHDAHRPKGLGPGSVAIYDAQGGIHSMVNRAMRVVCDSVTYVCGGVTMVLTSSGLAITGGTITHDGHLIDKTHVHTGVVPGGANTGTPP